MRKPAQTTFYSTASCWSKARPIPSFERLFLREIFVNQEFVLNTRVEKPEPGGSTIEALRIAGGLTDVSIQDILKGIENGKDLSFIATTLFLDAIEPLAKHFKPKDHLIRIDEQEDRNKIYDIALIIRS